MSYHTDLSPKDYHKLPSELRSYMKGNYLTRIAYRASVDIRRLGDAYRAMFGEDWESESYQKLYMVARAMEKNTLTGEQAKHYYKPYPMTMSLSKKSKHMLYGDYCENSVFFRKAAKLIGKDKLRKELANYVGIWQVNLTFDRQNELCKNIIKADNIVKRYAPELLKDYRAAVKGNISQHINIACRTTECEMKYLEKLVSSDLAEQYVKALIKSVARPSQMTGIIARIANDMGSDAGNVIRCNAYNDYWKKRYQKKFVSEVMRFNKAIEMKSMLDDLGFEDSEKVYGKMNDLNWGAYRICNKSYQTVKRVYKTKADNEVKRNTIINTLSAIHINNWKPREFAPTLNVNL